jgi:tRNA modification GTPase
LHTADRIATCITPPSRSAIATIRVTGFQFFDEFDSLFKSVSGKPISEFGRGKIVVGNWLNLQGTAEELVVTPVSASEMHIHCHGGAAPIKAILLSLESIGFLIHWNSKQILEQATELKRELQLGLLNAQTHKIAEYFLHLGNGCLETQVDRLIDLEGGPQLLPELKALSQSFQVGQFLSRPVATVLTGAANVGKSSLNNQILGYSRSIVFDQPGTTRDIISETTTIEGWVFELSDTAGLREPADIVETLGVEMAHEKLREADLVLHVVSPDQGLQSAIAELDSNPPASLGHSNAVIKVFNKADLLDSEQKQSGERKFPGILLTDAIQGQGIDQQFAVPEDPAVDQPQLFTMRQLQLVDAAIQATQQGLQTLADNLLRQLRSSE